MTTPAPLPPPPPPPGGNGPGKGGPTHAVSKASPPQKLPRARDRGDGNSAQTAYWTTTLWNNPSQTQYLVHRRNQVSPYPRWVRCTLGEARYEAETGYHVFELDSTHGRRVNLLAGQPQRAWDSASDRQLREIEEEEIARIYRHEPLAGEDLMEGTEEEDDVFDPTYQPSTPSGKGKGPHSHQSPGSGRLRGASNAGSPTTPRTPGGTRVRGPSNAGSPTARGPGSGGSTTTRTSRQGPQSPRSPFSGKGKGPGGSGGSPGAGGAST